jgi:voltage-gated potassium channel
LRARLAGRQYTLLLIVSLVLVLAPLLVGTSVRRSAVFGSVFLAVMLSGVLVVARQRMALILAILLGVPAGLLQISSFVHGTQQFRSLRLALFAGFLALMAVMIVRDVLKAESVTWDKIQGAICAYLLIGVAWGLLYAWIGLLDPQAFGGTGLQAAESAGEPMVYYSFVTLTTLGYGDITPVSHAARTLSWMEAAFGQIFLVVLVARLVSLHLTHSRRGGS